MTDENTTDPTPRPQTMLRSLGGDDLAAAYAEQTTGQLVLGLESIEHKLADLVKIEAMESEAYTCIDQERINLETELVRRRNEALRD